MGGAATTNVLILDLEYPFPWVHPCEYGTLNDTLNATNATDASPFPTLTPSLPACIGLSAIGGLLEVTSTMCLAFPEYKAKLGKPYSACTRSSVHAAPKMLP